MPTNTRGAGLGTGLWSDVTAWSTGAMPVAGEDVNLNGYVVAWDVLAGTTIPATGTLASLKSPAKAGQLTINLLTLGNITLNATTITGGTVTTGIIAVSGAAPTKTLTINGSVSGGTGTAAIGVNNTSTGSVNISGSVTGGSGANAVGSQNASTGSITIGSGVTGGSAAGAIGVYNATIGSINITGNVTGGSAVRTYGVFNNTTSIVTLNSCNLINSSFVTAYVGYPPVWNLAATNYLLWGTVYFAQQLLDHQILTGVVNGTITGNRVDCPVAKAVTTSGNYGDPDSPFVGTVVEKNYPIIGGSHIIKPARAA